MKSLLVCSILVLGLLVSRQAFAQPQSGAVSPVISAPGSSVAAAPAAPVNGPRITFAETSYTFGEIMMGKVVAHDFWFTNTGNAVLLISNVVPACHCTTAAAYTNEVAPGKTGVIPISYNSDGQPGGQLKRTSVTCNDPAQPVVNLDMKGLVIIPMEASPNFVVLTVKPDSTNDTVATVALHNNTDSPILLENPTSNQPGVAAELKTLRPGQDYELAIHTVANLTTNNALATITIKSSMPAFPTVTVLANVNILQPVYYTPAQMVIPLPEMPLPPNGFRVTINNNSVKPLSISDPTIDIPGATVKIVETDPGKQFQLSLSLPPALVIPAGTNYLITVKTSDPRYALISIPVRQIIRPVAPGFQPQVQRAAPNAPATPVSAQAQSAGAVAH